MRGVIGRPISAMLVALLAAMGLPHAVVAQDGCPPDPPYGTYACVLDFSWDEPVKVAYGVGTEVNELSHHIPRVDSLTGDFAATEGGCDDPIEPILITRRIGATEPIEPWNQAELGVGTHSYECGSGADWAGMRPSEGAPGEPWAYVIMATGTEPCEGHYDDTFDKAGNLLHRDQPEAATVYATVTCYRPGETEPSGTQQEVSGTVGVLNFAEWDKWRWSQHSDEPYPYRRPLPVVLGELTMPPISAGPEAEATVVQLAPEPDANRPSPGGDTSSNREEDGRPSPMFRLMALLVLLEVEEHGADASAGAVVTMLRFMRELSLERDYLDDPSDVVKAFLAEPDVGSADARSDDRAAVEPPAKTPPKMRGQAKTQGRKWVWLPAESSVHRKGATHWLKAGTWYQMRVDAEGNEVFYDRKGKLIGKSRSGVLKHVWGEESKALDTWGEKLSGDEAGRVLLAAIVDASTGSVMMRPAGPPPAVSAPHGAKWVYVPLPTQTYEKDQFTRIYEEKHILMPGRWYAGSFDDGATDVWDVDGNWLGDDVERDSVRFYEPPPG